MSQMDERIYSIRLGGDSWATGATERSLYEMFSRGWNPAWRIIREDDPTPEIGDIVVSRDDLPPVNLSLIARETNRSKQSIEAILRMSGFDRLDAEELTQLACHPNGDNLSMHLRRRVSAVVSHL